MVPKYLVQRRVELDAQFRFVQSGPRVAEEMGDHPVRFGISQLFRLVTKVRRKWPHARFDASGRRHLHAGDAAWRFGTAVPIRHAPKRPLPFRPVSALARVGMEKGEAARLDARALLVAGLQRHFVIAVTLEVQRQRRGRLATGRNTHTRLLRGFSLPSWLRVDRSSCASRAFDVRLRNRIV